jgi:hypothetical protein
VFERLRRRIASLSTSSCTKVHVAHRRLALHPSRALKQRRFAFAWVKTGVIENEKHRKNQSR